MTAENSGCMNTPQLGPPIPKAAGTSQEENGVRKNRKTVEQTCGEIVSKCHPAGASCAGYKYRGNFCQNTYKKTLGTTGAEKGVG